MDNAYKLDLSCKYNVSETFNATDLSLFDVETNLSYSRSNYFEARGMQNSEYQDSRRVKSSYPTLEKNLYVLEFIKLQSLEYLKPQETLLRKIRVATFMNP